MDDSQRNINGTREQIIAVIPRVSRKKGLLGFRRETYTMVVTNQRLLFAQVSKAVLARQTRDLEELRKHNKAEGKGFFASWGDTIATGMSWYNRYLEMDPEAILAETETNFFLKKPDILSLKIADHLGMDQADSNTPLPFFIVKTRGSKYKFMLSRNYDSGQFKMLKKWSKSS